MPRMATPSVEWLKQNPFQLGDAKFHLLPKQWEFMFCKERYPNYTGGYGCLRKSVKINGIDVAGLTGPSEVHTLFGSGFATQSYRKGQADLYRVKTSNGHQVEVTLDHRFLTPSGWAKLRDIAAGSLIAVDGSASEDLPKERRLYWRDLGRKGSRFDDGVSSPQAVAARELYRRPIEPDIYWIADGNSRNARPSIENWLLRELREGEPVPSADGASSEYLPDRRRETGQSVPYFLQRYSEPRPHRSESAYGPNSLCLDGGHYESGFDLQRFGSSQAPYRPPESFRTSGTPRLLSHGQSSASVGQGKSHVGALPEKRQTGEGRAALPSPPESSALRRSSGSVHSQEGVQSACSDSTAIWAEITSVSFLENADFYDLTVPVTHHYLANGIYHHNSGKTQAGVYRGALLSMQPDNLGIVGRSAETQLELTTKRDFMQFLHDAKLLKSEPNKKHGAIVYCVDPKTNKPLGKTSEIQFDHMEDPDHIHGSHTGWFWMDERAESPFASFLKLVGRNRRPNIPFRSGFATGNPNGHDWGYDFWFNPQKVLELAKEIQLERRAIHATSYENYYLDPQYIKDMESAYPEEWLKRYLLGDMDIFEGQIFKEFDQRIHCVLSRQCGFVGGEPPESWSRYLGIDVGGADPWAFEFAAVDPWGNVVFYNEIYRPGEFVDQFAHDAKAIMKDRRFVTVIDWENKLASAELRRLGIPVNNARKRGKMDSITNIGGYLHPNPKRAFPSWHPMAGQPGSPGVFFTEGVPNLIREVPQQRWKKLMGTEVNLNQLDDRVSRHGFDASLYLLRERPRPEALQKLSPSESMAPDIDKRSAYYLLLEAEQDKKQKPSTGMRLPFRQAPTAAMVH